MRRWSFEAIPGTLRCAKLPIVVNVKKLMVVRSSTPAALASPPVVPFTFSGVPPPSCGLSAWFADEIVMLPAVILAESPTAAVVFAVTLFLTSAPAPASRPPANVVICELKVAIWSAPRLKPWSREICVLPPIDAVVTLPLVVCTIAAEPAIAPPEPAFV